MSRAVEKALERLNCVIPAGKECIIKGRSLEM